MDLFLASNNSWVCFRRLCKLYPNCKKIKVQNNLELQEATFTKLLAFLAELGLKDHQLCEISFEDCVIDDISYESGAETYRAEFARLHWVIESIPNGIYLSRVKESDSVTNTSDSNSNVTTKTNTKTKIQSNTNVSTKPKTELETESKTETETKTSPKPKPKTKSDKQKVEPFVNHMSYEEANNLRVSDTIDHPDTAGMFLLAKIIEKKDKKLKIHYTGWSSKHDTWSDYNLDIGQFACAGSVSKRPAHRFTHLEEGDCIDICPYTKHCGWKSGKIKRKCEKSGQVQVFYCENGQQVLWWAHLDNREEIAAHRLKVQHQKKKQKQKIQKPQKPQKQIAKCQPRPQCQPRPRRQQSRDTMDIFGTGLLGHLMAQRQVYREHVQQVHPMDLMMAEYFAPRQRLVSGFQHQGYRILEQNNLNECDDYEIEIFLM
jgi:hypothetical protein